MKLAVLGTSGKTAREVIIQALERGYEVIAIDNRISKAKDELDYKNLETVSLKSYNEGDLKRELSGCAAVLFCLDYNGGPFTHVTVFSETMREVVPAMRAAGIKRMVVVTARCTKAHPSHPLYHEWIMRPLVLGRVLSDMLRMETYLRVECSDMNYTVVKPPHLVNGRNNDIYQTSVVAKEGEFVRQGKCRLPRAYLAKFMLDCLRLTLWDRKLVAIALPD